MLPALRLPAPEEPKSLAVPTECRVRLHIRAADPSRTRILGNFQYRYWFKEIDTSDATWARKTLGGAHARMELDPEVWAHVEQLIRDGIAGRR